MQTVVTYLMDFEGINIRIAVKRLYLTAAIIYVVSLLLRIVGPYFTAVPSIVGEHNRPLAGTLRFIFNELTSIISPITASFCLILAITMHLTLTSRRTDFNDGR